MKTYLTFEADFVMPMILKELTLLKLEVKYCEDDDRPTREKYVVKLVQKVIIDYR
jgi:hypothetical protein